MSLDNLDQKLQAEQPTLSASEEASLWQRIAPQVSAPKAVVVSPYSIYLSLRHSRTMTSLIIALIFILGAGGTVAVSEAAKPGDLLFPIERVAEKTRLAFAGEERAAELKAAYANERWEELLEIIEEEGTVTAFDSAASTSASSTVAITKFSAEADVFTDITVVKVEANDRKRIFTTATTTKAGVIEEIANRYALATSTIEAGLDFEIEDRASRPSERGVVLVDNTGEERISRAVNVLLDLLSEVDSEDARSALLNALLTQIDNVSVKGRDDNNNDDDSRIDIRSEDSRVRIDDDRMEIREDGYRIRIDKDGEIKVKQDDDSEDDSRDDEDDEDDEKKYSPISSSTATSSTKIKLEVEADVYTDITEVKVELNDVKTSFVTLAKTKDAIAQEVAVLYRVEKSLVLQVLDFEIEDGSSDGDDTGSRNDDDDYGDDEEEDEDRDRGGDRDDEEEDEDRDDDEDDEDGEDHEEREDENEDEEDDRNN